MGIPVSLFINPDHDDINASGEIGADMVEITYGHVCECKREKAKKEFSRIIGSVKCALDSGLLVNAGHGLNYFNVSGIASVKDLRGLYIGHSIVSRAVSCGNGGGCPGDEGINNKGKGELINAKKHSDSVLWSSFFYR